MLTGKHLIAGSWVAGEATFQSSPAFGEPYSFAVGTPRHVDTACNAAEAAFADYASDSRQVRACFLNQIADEI